MDAAGFYYCCWWWWCLLIFCSGMVAADREVDQADAELLVPELIVKYGYEVEGHTVVTEDGYVLKMFRILPRRREGIAKKLPVLLVHGLLASSADFVVSGPNNSLVYLLADNGYDVWLANVRGSRYSKEHSKLSVDSKEYWDFSWHEMGYYDLPAMIDHVLKVANSEKLFYIGHSQGSTVYFVLTSSRPEYNAKIALMVALSPAVGVEHVRSPILRFMLKYANMIEKILEKLNIYEFLPFNEQYHFAIRPLCQPEIRNNPCIRSLELTSGPNPEMLDPRLVLLYQGHFPQGTSVKLMMHHVQIARNGGRFRQFDYGPTANLQRYGLREPPPYNLTASTAPVIIYYAVNDWIVHPRDVLRFSKRLPRVIGTVPVADRKFNHLDFMLAKNARQEVYEKILPVLNGFS